MRQPLFRDDRSRKESYHKDDRSKKDSYHREDRSKNRSKKDSYYGDDRLKKEAYHRDNRLKKESYHRDDRSRKDLYHRDDHQKKYSSLRKDKNKSEYQSSHGNHQSRRAALSYDKYGLARERSSYKDSRATTSHKRLHHELRDSSFRRTRSKRERYSSEEPEIRQKRLKLEAIRLEQEARDQIKLSKEETKRLDKEFRQYNISRGRATLAEVRQGNTNRDAWADKYVELEKAKSNIRRHERVGNLLQHVPGVQQALHEQADRLKAGPDSLKQEMAKLKSEGKYDEELNSLHHFEETQKWWGYRDKVNKHADLIYANEEKLRKYGKL